MPTTDSAPATKTLTAGDERLVRELKTWMNSHACDACEQAEEGHHEQLCEEMQMVEKLLKKFGR